MSSRDAETFRPGPQMSRLILGLTLIAIGVIHTLDRLGYLNARDLLVYWPVVLIVAGASKLFAPGSGASRTTGALIAGVGTWLLFDNLGWIDASFWDWWPLLLIMIGLYLMLSPRQVVETSSHDTVNAFAMLAGSGRKHSTSNFRGGDMVAFMGGCELDLRACEIAAGQPAVIDAFAFWGGIEIRVPEHWRVVSRGIPVLGGFEDSTRQTAKAEEGPGLENGEGGARFLEEDDRPELIVKGFAIMGGVEIEN